MGRWEGEWVCERVGGEMGCKACQCVQADS